MLNAYGQQCYDAGPTRVQGGAALMIPHVRAANAAVISSPIRPSAADSRLGRRPAVPDVRAVHER
jgi:hypothetical protein